MTLAQYLRDFGVSADAFAAEIGVTQPYVSRLCTGDRTPSVMVALAIERATGRRVLAATLSPEVAAVEVASLERQAQLETQA